jgi:hypothetical protein
MPSPRTALNGYRPDLGTMFQLDDMANRAGHIWNRVAPVVESDQQNGTFGKIPLKQLLKEPEVGRNSRGDYNRTNFTFEDSTFATKEKGIEIPVDARQAKIYKSFFDFETVCARQALSIVLRAAEKRWADAIFNATTFAAQLTSVGNEWDDATNATPVSDVEAACRAVWARTGMWPNALVINRHVFRNLRLCDQVTDTLASLGAGVSIEPGKITVASLASVFDLPYVIVAGSARDSANEGQTASIANVWSNEYAMVCRVAETSDFEEPCLARTIHWGEDGSSVGGTIETYYSDEARGDIVRVRHEVEEKIVYTEMGQLLDNITT